MTGINGTATLSHTAAGGGYELVTGRVTATELDNDQLTVCNRTPQIRDAIVDKVSGKTTCGQITAQDLAG